MKLNSSGHIKINLAWLTGLGGIVCVCVCVCVSHCGVWCSLFFLNSPPPPTADLLELQALSYVLFESLMALVMNQELWGWNPAVCFNKHSR